MNQVVTIGSYHNIKSREVRFLQEAANLGELTVLLWSDNLFEKQTKTKATFPENERKYFVESLRFVKRVVMIDDLSSLDEIPGFREGKPEIWALQENEAFPFNEDYCKQKGIEYSIIPEVLLSHFPILPFRLDPHSANTKVIVSGSFDWLHTGHVRFFEETSELGDLYVIVGHDQNLQLLKGAGHPLFPENERLYMVQSIRFVHQAMISTGRGWLDAEPEIQLIKPDIYAVNEDGDVPEKRNYCQEHNLQYQVLKRKPKPGLIARQSTDLRGF
jgi:cytidyltransferase-like protein